MDTIVFTKTQEKLTLKGICPIAVKGPSFKNFINIDSLPANKVCNVFSISQTGKFYHETDRSFRTIGDKKEFKRNWIGHRTHDFFLSDNIITIEYTTASDIQLLKFESSKLASEYFNILTNRN